MPDTQTTNFHIVKPDATTDKSPDTWGNKLNDGLDIIDEALRQTRDNKIERDGSIPFTAVVSGVTPTTDAHLATKKYIDDKIKANWPNGLVVKWSGTVASIPSGWSLCNGATMNGVVTPDLRDKFVVCHGSVYTQGTSSGALTHDHGGNVGGTAVSVAQLPAHGHGITGSHGHSVTDPGHIHGPFTIVASTTGVEGGSGAAQQSSTTSNTGSKVTGISLVSAVTGITIQNTGSGSTHNHTVASASNLPPYFALAFICKTSYV